MRNVVYKKGDLVRADGVFGIMISEKKVLIINKINTSPRMPLIEIKRINELVTIAPATKEDFDKLESPREMIASGILMSMEIAPPHLYLNRIK